MEREEFKKALFDYFDSEKELHNYFRQFFTEYMNRQLIHKATKFWNEEESEKINKMEDELEKKRTRLREAEKSLFST
ncbi:MAG: hypothetical protein ABH830_02310 [Patescibacteria group bacterium]